MSVTASPARAEFTGPPVPILMLETVDSTNAEARRRAESGEAGPLWISALTQTAGRGRRGRAWQGGSGNLAATLLITTSRAPADAARTSFVAALAVADLVATYAPDELVRLKWPNDVQLDGRKVSGVLIDSGRMTGTQALWLAVGIGVNLNSAPTGLERPATCVADHLRMEHEAPPSPAQALAVLSAAFSSYMDLWDRSGFPAIASAWTRRAEGLGRPCVARLEQETISGVAEGLDEDGALRLRLANGAIHRISAGDVFFSRD